MPYNIWCGGCGNHIGMGKTVVFVKRKRGPRLQRCPKCTKCTAHSAVMSDFRCTIQCREKESW